MSGNSVWDYVALAVVFIVCAVYITRRALRLFGKEKGGSACGSSCCSDNSGCSGGPAAKKDKPS